MGKRLSSPYEPATWTGQQIVRAGLAALASLSLETARWRSESYHTRIRLLKEASDETEQVFVINLRMPLERLLRDTACKNERYR